MRKLWARSMIHAGDKRAVQEEKESPVICNRKNTSFFLLRKKNQILKNICSLKRFLRKENFEENM